MVYFIIFVEEQLEGETSISKGKEKKRKESVKEEVLKGNLKVQGLISTFLK